MPHYKDGTPATAGDTIRGKGYNIKGPGGALAEITGVLLHVDPNSTACNVQVAVVEIHKLAPVVDEGNGMASGQAPPAGSIPLRGGHYATLRLEYGQADHFQKV